MKNFISLLKLSYKINLQYRSALLTGILTQLVWGGIIVLVYRALYYSNPNSFPMSLESTVTYIWLQQAFLPLFMFWLIDKRVFDSISNGNVAYELCRPIKIYNLWFLRDLANRTIKTLIRCWPILLVTLLFPKCYGILLPENPFTILIFFISMILASIVTISICMFAYIVTFYTLSPLGVRLLFLYIVEFFSGVLIPLPFFPEAYKKVIYFLPFASMQNVPFRIYSGDIVGTDIIKNLILQLFWASFLVFLGKALCNRAVKNVVLQGG